MKKIDERFLQEAGTGLFSGNELLLKGGLESEIALITGYPGSPVAEVFDTAESIQDLLLEHGIVAQIANNEALGAARLNGSQMANIRAMAVMKSVGVHVASDALALSNLSGTSYRGGAIAVMGDDPWSEGTQVPADSRMIAQHLYLPTLEPSTYQEIKDWIGLAFDLSERTNLYIAYILTSNQADGGGTVTLSPNRYPLVNMKHRLTLDTSMISSTDRVVIPPDTAVKEVELVQERFPALLRLSREYGVNQILYRDGRRHAIGFISTGLTYCYLEHALHIFGLSGVIPILRLGLSYPVDPVIVREFAEGVKAVYVVEEKRGFIEMQVAAILKDLVQRGELSYVPLWGKDFSDGLPGIPSTKGLNPSVLVKHLGPILKRIDDPYIPVDRGKIDRELALLNEVETYDVAIPGRTPSFCPGCPHRDSASAIKQIADQFMDPEYMRKHHGTDPVDLVFHGDIGCYSMLKYEPYGRLMHNLSGMGLGGGTGAGIDSFINNKQIVFMGDSTFFHSGMVAVSDSIKNNQDITYIILDNGTTAMTGHQPTPGNDVDIMGRPTFAQDIEEVVSGLARRHRPSLSQILKHPIRCLRGDGQSNVFIARVNPENRDTYKRLLENVFLKDGVKVIVADKECGITYHRRLNRERRELIKQTGFLPEERHINVTPEVCEYCLECTKATACTGLTIIETPYGPKIATDRSSCVTDGACAKIKACPSFEEVILKRKQVPVVKVTERDLTVPLPTPRSYSFKDVWYAYIAGVGGMGVGMVSAILARAGMKQGYEVRFANKKGLAIRNGPVYAHVSFSRLSLKISPVTPYGKANLLFGLDILEAVRGLDPKGNLRVGSPSHTVAVVNIAKTPTVTTLIGHDDFNPQELEHIIKRYTQTDRYIGANLSKLSEEFLGNKLYANITMLGLAYQQGLLPLDLESLEWAIDMSVRPAERTQNRKAFLLGRHLAIRPQMFALDGTSILPTYTTTLNEKADILQRTKWRGKRFAQTYRTLVEDAAQRMALDETTAMHFALRVYDLIQYEDIRYARSYVDRVLAVRKKDFPEAGYTATQAVIRYLYKVMTIKDEIFVAHLLTSEEKWKHDLERYNADPARGDRIIYRHLTRPRFTIFSRDIEFSMTTRNWQLALMKRMKWLRRVMPEWHRREKQFRDWYIALVDQFDPQTFDEYNAYVQVLSLPEEVRGYREVRYPKMEEAIAMAEQILMSHASHYKKTTVQYTPIGQSTSAVPWA